MAWGRLAPYIQFSILKPSNYFIMLARNLFAAMQFLLVLLIFPPSNAAENPISISLDAVVKPFSKHALSYPKHTVDTFTRGIEYLTDNAAGKENKTGQNNQYPSFPTYRTKLSIKSNYNISGQGNTTGRMNEEQKSVTALVDISSPFVWMQGTAPLSLAIDYPINSSCRPSDYSKGSGASYVADLLFPPSVSNIKFVYDEAKGINDGSDGILAVFGFSNYPCSLLRQLGYSNFSYCFAPNSSQSSAILLGSDFTLRKSWEHQPAQLVQNNNFPFAYSVNLSGISVGNTEVPVDALAFQENGPVNMILDSVTPVTLLKREAYESVKQEFLYQMSQMEVANVPSSSLGLDLCFSNPTFWPQLALKFFPAATMTLSRENYVVREHDTGLECLAILPSQDVSVMGTMMQVNHLMIFDVDKSTLSFEQANCGLLSISSSTDVSVPRGVQIIHHISLVATFFVCMLVIN